MYQIACQIDAGVGGHGNDDRCYINEELVCDGYYELDNAEYAFVGVCDGVGGELFGYEASGSAAGYMRAHASSDVSMEGVAQLVAGADIVVKCAQGKSPEHSQMATTIAGLIASGDDMVAFNVGDSRVYRFRDPYISQLTKDHSIAEEMRELGIQVNPARQHVITRCLGGEDSRPYIFNGIGRAFEEDVYVLCSDGISDVLSDMAFEEILAEQASLKDLCGMFISRAIEYGSDDNLSVIIVRRV